MTSSVAITQKQAAIAREAISRQSEAMLLFRADERQIPCLQCERRETLIRGGNRSGKSTLAAVRFAAQATDRPVLGPDGEPYYQRRKDQQGRALTMWVVGIQLNHIGQTVHRLLFRSGLFKVIRDKKTKQWRAYREWDEEDRERRDEAKPSAPLIPQRYINPKSWSWENKSERQFTKVEIWDPSDHKKILAEIYAFASSSEVKQGDPVDEIWIDEAIKYAGHYAEWQARLIDRDGRITWSSWPRMSNDALVRLSERAKACKELEDDDPDKTVEEFVYTMSGNPHIPAKAKQAALSGWSEDERKARDLGHFLTDGLLIYPTYSKNVHCALAPEKENDDEIGRILRERRGEPPDNWTRYLILDPGTVKPGVLFAAVPPPVYGDYIVPYDEIYVRRINAEQLADRVLPKVQGHVFEEFIIDFRMARQTPSGMGLSVGSNYSKAFEARNIRCSRTGTNFSYGSDNIVARWGMMHQALSVRHNGTTRIRIYNDRCPNLVKQMQQYMKKQEQGVPVDKPDPHQKDDLVVCLEYLVSKNPQWHDPGQSDLGGSAAYQRYREIERRRASRNEKSADNSIHAGPGFAA